MKRFSWKKWPSKYPRLFELFAFILGIYGYSWLWSVWWGFLIALVIITALLICWWIRLVIFKKEEFFGNGFAVVGIVCGLFQTRSCRFEQENIQLIFFGIGAGVGLIFGLLTLYFFKKEKNSRRWGTFAVVMVTSAAFSMMSLTNINVQLDASRPQVVQGVVVDKIYHYHRKLPDTKRLKVEIDGEETYLNVSRNSYRKINEGDLALIGHYDGALGFPYSCLVGYTPMNQQSD